MITGDMDWFVETLDETAEAETEPLSPDRRARPSHIARQLDAQGWQPGGSPQFKKLGGQLWEVRLEGRSEVARALAVTVSPNHVVIVGVFPKRTRWAPAREIELALERVRSRRLLRKPRKTRIADLHKKWMKELDYRVAYEELREDYSLATKVIEARSRAGLTQEQLAHRFGVTQPSVARLESGIISPTLRTLRRLARGTDSTLAISFEPRQEKRPGGGRTFASPKPASSRDTMPADRRRTV